MGRERTCPIPLNMIFENERTVPAVKLTNSKALIALLLVSAAALTACGGGASGSASGGPAKSASPAAISQSASGVQPVSLSMDDYLGSTVVLYFSFPG